jgi:hypothetical protein
MHKADATNLNLKVPTDVRAHLARWANDHYTSLSAELIRSVRERAAREEREKAVRG